MSPAIDELRHKAEALHARADALGEAYRKRTWWRFALVFFPVPFLLVLLRLEVEAWHYYLFGAAYIAFSAGLYMWDGRASARWDAAVKAADGADEALRRALRT